MIKTAEPLITINCPNLTHFKEGKVRQLYDLGEHLLLVATDRVSAFDFILPDGVPSKGAVLTNISEHWFSFFKNDIKHHLVSTNVNDFPSETKPYQDQLEGRTMLVKKTELIEFECVVRGYIVGSGWKDYQRTGQICGIDLPSGLQLADPLPEPIFTPATKATDGHDMNVSFETMSDSIGTELANQLREKSLMIYQRARDYADTKGIILADTKFEFGLLNNEIILIDEVLTPDSSRFWPKEDYRPGISPPSFDKQIIRDHLENSGWDKKTPVPHLPEEVIARTTQRYLEVQERLWG